MENPRVPLWEQGVGDPVLGAVRWIEQPSKEACAPQAHSNPAKSWQASIPDNLFQQVLLVFACLSEAVGIFNYTDLTPTIPFPKDINGQIQPSHVQIPAS